MARVGRGAAGVGRPLTGAQSLYVTAGILDCCVLLWAGRKADSWPSGARQRRTEFAQISAAAAVLHILKLDGETIRVGEIQLRRSTLSAAAIWHAQRDVGHERRASLAVLL